MSTLPEAQVMLVKMDKKRIMHGIFQFVIMVLVWIKLELEEIKMTLSGKPGVDGHVHNGP